MITTEAESNPFKDSVKGSWLTYGLFFETTTRKELAIYTLKGYDLVKEDEETGEVKVYKSLKLLYLECNDPTEYTFANEYLGGWEHWQRLQGNSEINEYIITWREELEVKLRSMAVRAMMQTAVAEGSKGTTAAKWLADKGWTDRRGRPSKAEVERQKKIHANIKDEIAEDAERLGLLN
jgi:hypothetical protein